MSVVESGDTLQLHFVSKRPDGEIFENTRTQEPVTVIIGNKQINPAFEEALIGKTEGDTVTVVLPPEKAYGKYLKRLVLPIKRKKTQARTCTKSRRYHHGRSIRPAVQGHRC